MSESDERAEPARDGRISVFDTTLRDGAQREGIAFSVADKLAVARLIDELGVAFIEGGWPGAMPKDTEFFARAANELALRNAQLVAFGSTRKPGVHVEDDQQVTALLDAGAPVITLVAKSDVLHVARALRTSLDENVAMVAETVRYLVENGRDVFVDLEHFFDGYRHDPGYGVVLLDALAEAGASIGVLCDTNGGMLPSGIARVVRDIAARTATPLGIHCQDDTGCAVANTIAAVEAGATQVQCTANGYGERTGNADIFAVVANLQIKLGIQAVPAHALPEMVRISHAIAEIANLLPDSHQPYVGASSFAHKAGLHASALRVDPGLYNHIDPALVGNDMRVLVTEMAGRASVELKGRELGLDLGADPRLLARVTDQVKDLEAAGWTFEAADASFELLVRDVQAGQRVRPFAVESWRVIVERARDADPDSEATVKVRVGDARVAAVGEGNGPVNALDTALRTALNGMFPGLTSFHLTDYKVRIVDAGAGTGAVTRVLIDTTDGHRTWTTVGVHENVIAASWIALEDAIAYGLLGADLPGGQPHSA